jgi:DNA (cytosine-5)-methyltransferase 1
MLLTLPSYAREQVDLFRNWKIRYIQQNRDWWMLVAPYIPAEWKDGLKVFPPSLRKLEWNVKGEKRDLWSHVLQFRPSGLRVKRYSSSPALVAMTATQIPVLGPEKRFITRVEGKRLQGFPDQHELPITRAHAFKALGNAVHVGVIELLADRLVSQSAASMKVTPNVFSLSSQKKIR